MGEPLQFKPDRNFAPLLATAIVLMGGVSVCLGIMFASGNIEPMPIVIAIGVSLGMGVLLWSLRERPVARQRSLFEWMRLRGGRKQRLSYEMRIVHPERVEYGNKRPPTLDDLREARDETRTWVPAAHRKSSAAERPATDADA